MSNSKITASRNVLLAMVVCFIFVDCNNEGSLQSKMINQLKRTETTNVESWEITISEITPFAWDTMYYFRHSASYEKIKSTLGSAYDGGGEFSDKYFFFRADTLIYNEYVKVDIEKVTNDAIVYVIPDTTFFVKCSYDNCKFNVRKVRSSGIHYFELDRNVDY